VVLLIGFLLDRSQSGNDLNVTLEAERVIEETKATVSMRRQS